MQIRRSVIQLRFLAAFVIGHSLLSAVNSQAVTISVPGLFNTGVNNSGVVHPQQSLEQHYSMSGAASIAYIVPPVYAPNMGWEWLPARPNSTTNTASPDPVGVYHYTIQFDLTGYNLAAVRISGSWMTDNSGMLFLNGLSTGFMTDPESYKHLAAFDLTSGFVAGMNTLEFRVFNEFVGPNPSGLCVADLSATLVPEPSTVVLAMGLILGVAMRHQLRKKQNR